MFDAIVEGCSGSALSPPLPPVNSWSSTVPIPAHSARLLSRQMQKLKAQKNPQPIYNGDVQG